MSTSEAKKKRKQAIRSGKADPADYRLNWNGLSGVTRVTPTKQEVMMKQQHKHKKKWNPDASNDARIPFLLFYTL
ncbi:hypothetical protein FHS18_006950 [Paenibacillus phyllosphaerae]|uniref:Uncharacterized protein n=1 Tax=Paenibacillus phyllosphaerae TaxID=274593 RepID=A0A7W5FRQ8_9BACL|nr:hypothetical protein [Paenibacillus phyllosphaerae]MBB3114790.1 hypothetical protein [Paenibacillus phyllosphaerae]